MTHTRVHVHTLFANPFLRCLDCGEKAVGFHDGKSCGCDDGTWLVPCVHAGRLANTSCPSWSPVDGCTCGVKH